MGVIRDHPGKVASFCVCLLMAIILLATSFHNLSSKEYGVQWDTVSHKLGTEVKEQGKHSGPPFFKFIKFLSVYKTVNIPEDVSEDIVLSPGGLFTCVASDGLLIELRASFQYVPMKLYLRDIILNFRNPTAYEQVVKDAGLAATSAGCSDFTVENFQTQRGLVQSKMLANLVEKLETTENEIPGRDLFAKAVDFQLREVTLPELYQSIVREVQTSEETIDLAINQRQQELTVAETSLQSSVEVARKTLATARINAATIIKEAEFAANATLLQYKTEATIYEDLKDTLGLSTAGFLAYLGNRVLEQHEGPISVAMAEPATFSYTSVL